MSWSDKKRDALKRIEDAQKINEHRRREMMPRVIHDGEPARSTLVFDLLLFVMFCTVGAVIAAVIL